MQNFDLAEHLVQQLVFDWLINWLSNLYVSLVLLSILHVIKEMTRIWSRGDALAFLALIVAVHGLIRDYGRNLDCLIDATIIALASFNLLPILVGVPQLAQEANDLVAIVAFFWLQWNFLADHAR